MNRRNAMLVAGAVGLAAVAAVGVQYPNYKRAKRDAELMRNENRVESLISREIARGDGTRVDLDKLVDLPWNRVYVLAPYTTFESARREMPGAWCLRDHAGIDLRDDICILAFYEGSKLVARIPQPRALGDFSGAVRQGGYPRGAARFRLAGGRAVYDAG